MPPPRPVSPPCLPPPPTPTLSFKWQGKPLRFPILSKSFRGLRALGPPADIPSQAALGDSGARAASTARPAGLLWASLCPLSLLLCILPTLRDFQSPLQTRPPCCLSRSVLCAQPVTNSNTKKNCWPVTEGEPKKEDKNCSFNPKSKGLGKRERRGKEMQQQRRKQKK